MEKTVGVTLYLLGDYDEGRYKEVFLEEYDITKLNRNSVRDWIRFKNFERTLLRNDFPDQKSFK